MCFRKQTQSRVEPSVELDKNHNGNNCKFSCRIKKRKKVPTVKLSPSLGRSGLCNGVPGAGPEFVRLHYQTQKRLFRPPPCSVDAREIREIKIIKLSTYDL